MTTYQSFTIYCRTSTADQINGLIAQQSAVEAYVDSVGGQVSKVFIEQASGADNDRPIFAKAIQHSILTGSQLAVKEQTRFSRDAAFAIGIMKTPGLRVVFTDSPNSCEFIDLIHFGMGDEAR